VRKVLPISTNLTLKIFLPLQGGGQEGDGVRWCGETHPHPAPPLEGEGVFDGSGRLVPIRKVVETVVVLEVLEKTAARFKAA